MPDEVLEEESVARGGEQVSSVEQRVCHVFYPSAAFVSIIRSSSVARYQEMVCWIDLYNKLKLVMKELELR